MSCLTTHCPTHCSPTQANVSYTDALIHSDILKYGIKLLLLLLLLNYSGIPIIRPDCTALLQLPGHIFQLCQPSADRRCTGLLACMPALSSSLG